MIGSFSDSDMKSRPKCVRRAMAVLAAGAPATRDCCSTTSSAIDGSAPCRTVARQSARGSSQIHSLQLLQQRRDHLGPGVRKPASVPCCLRGGRGASSRAATLRCTDDSPAAASSSSLTHRVSAAHSPSCRTRHQSCLNAVGLAEAGSGSQVRECTTQRCPVNSLNGKQGYG